ncbi:MAG: ankyrin repeat domain-containing protein [Gemmatimonadaceae bacterium]
MWIAIHSGDKRMIELLASYGATWEIPIRPEGALTYEEIAATGLRRTVEVLAYFGDIATAAQLFESNPSLANQPDALEAAAKGKHEAFVQLLLRYQPDLAKRVTVAKPREMAEFLFTNGMDPNRPNWVRRTPLHHLASDGDVESAALFIDHGADINARDAEDRSTPLAFAARKGKVQMVKFLLQRGAKPRLPDDPSWATPMAWATRRGHEDVVRLLKEYERTGALPPS